MRKVIVLNPNDNVAVALTDLKAEELVEIPIGKEVIKVRAIGEIPSGHKIAIKEIAEGEPIIKYGEVIGVATKHIGVGEHVHVHNVSGLRGRSTPNPVMVENPPT